MEYDIEQIEKQNEKRKRTKQIVKKLLFIIIIILLYNIFLITKSTLDKTDAKSMFGYRAYVITTNSMEPTINVGDIIIVSGIEKDKIQEENLDGLKNGMNNLYRHIENLKNVFGVNVIVAINKYNHDTIKEIEFLKRKLQEKGIELSLVESWEKGGEGAVDLANKIADLTLKESNFNYAYELNMTVKEKIEAIAQKIYGASKIEYLENTEEKIEKIEKMGYGNLPICIAKTQYSFSDDPKNLECIHPFNIHIKDVVLKAGAEFIVIITGKIMTMPGLPRIPAAENIDIDKNGNIIGIF